LKKAYWIRLWSIKFEAYTSTGYGLSTGTGRGTSTGTGLGLF